METARRLIGVVTSSRADFGLLKGLMRAIRDSERARLAVFATGMHHSPEHGHTIDEVRAAGFAAELIEVPLVTAGDGPEAIADSMGRGVSAFASVLARHRPDLLVVLGDRFDALPAALAALPHAIPVAHVSGGELTEGMIDDPIRHSLTKLSHLHFPSTQVYADRLRQMGEEDWRIVVSGQPGLDEMVSFTPSPREGILKSLGLDPDRKVTLFTYHPETLAADRTGDAIAEILDAASRVDTQIVFTGANTDTGNRAIRDAVATFVTARPDCINRASLGRSMYLEMLNQADCMVGNSSSGLIEAASFKLPVVNIGERQRGRLAPANVIPCTGDAASVEAAWRTALSAEFRAGLAGLVNPYGDGRAVERIVEKLVSVPLDRRLLVKRFVDRAGWQ